MTLTTHDHLRIAVPRARALALAVLVVLSALTALAPGAAHAGTYPMYNCHVAGHETGNQGPWTYATAFGTPKAVFTSHCAGAGGSNGPGFGTYASTYIGRNSRVNLTLDKDDSHIAIANVKLWFHANTAIAPGYQAGPIKTTLWTDGVQHVAWSNGQVADFLGAPYEFRANNQVQLSLECSATAADPNGCMPKDAFTIAVQGVQADLTEGVAPAAAIAGGTLTTSGAHKGTQTAAVDATDGDSGVRKVELLLDDKVVGKIDYDRDWTRPLSEQQAGTCAFDNWNACPTSQSPSFSVDTRLVPDGTYAMTARVTDAAGNVSTTAPRAVTIDNVPDPVAPRAPDPIPGAPGAPGVDGANGPKGANGNGGAIGANGATVVLTVNGANGAANATLKAAFVSTNRGSINAAYGKKVLITGQLIAPNGQPITGARVSVQQQDKLVGAHPVPAGEVITDEYGKFRYVATATRSRTVRFGYRANLEDATFSQITDISLNVIPKVALRTDKKSLRNGQTVRFIGSIAGAPANARKVVELQVKKRNRWMTFDTTRLHNGKFSAKYRFTATHRRTVYTFRVRVRQEAGFPFLTGVSKQVKVTVRG
jgi:Bacterial Ig-like domain